MNSWIDWFARNSVAANLLMFVIVGLGIVTMFTVKQEVFPEFSLDMITISVPYPGAAPEEVEEAVCVRIEEEIEGLEGIKEITSSSRENLGQIMVEVDPDADSSRLLDEIKSRVDAIDTFPDDVEEPVIEEVINRRQVIYVSVSGDTDERSLKELGKRVRDEIAGLPEVSLVELANARPYEISIEVSEEALRRYGLTFDQVVAAVRRTSIDLPGGSLRTDGGEILLRTKGQAYSGTQFERIPVVSRPDGSRLTVGDVANVVDGFAETDQASQFDGEPSVLLGVFRVGDQSAIAVAKAVQRYVEETRPALPEGISIETWGDNSRVLQSRMDLLLRNGRNGFFLVFGLLALFLRFRLAFWVSLGIPISFLGAMWMMPGLDVSINLISLFAFIVVLGIVVDDAIVVGENIYTHQRRGGNPLEAAIAGAKEVSVPVVFAVLTSIAAFAPLLNVEGSTGKIMRVIPLIVIPTLAFSLVESLFILPAHLSHGRAKNGQEPRFFISKYWYRVQRGFVHGFEAFVDRVYRPSLELALNWRYAALAIGLATFMLSVGLVRGGWIKFTFFPPVEADYVVGTVTMPLGTPADVTQEAVSKMEQVALDLKDSIDVESGDSKTFQHILASVGEQPVQAARSGGPRGDPTASFSAAHLGEVAIELTPAEDRDIASQEILNRWREGVGAIPDAVELKFSSSLFSPGDAINIQLTGLDLEKLEGASAAVRNKLAEYPGVFDIADSFREGKKEVKLSIKPEAEALGLTMADLAQQVRQGFYGAEAQSVQRGRDEVKVMVRYPAAERNSLADLENMRIRTPGGVEVPFSNVAEAEFGRGYESIRRVDRRRAVNVTADVDDVQANASEVLADMSATFLPSIKADFGVDWSLEGQQAEQRDTLAGLGRGFLVALVVIFALMAVPFRSYVQPLIVMAAIPFGLVGAIWGHVIMGMNLTILSMFGLVALTGVVVNDSLVMVDRVNRLRAETGSVLSAVHEAGVQRFRPILLTSLTTFAGLTPLLLEKSMQAKFLVPMAVSLAFGVVFATFITLVLVPSLYMILEDIRPRFSQLLRVLFKRTESADSRSDSPVEATGH